MVHVYQLLNRNIRKCQNFSIKIFFILRLLFRKFQDTLGNVVASWTNRHTSRALLATTIETSVGSQYDSQSLLGRMGVVSHYGELGDIGGTTWLIVLSVGQQFGKNVRTSFFVADIHLKSR